MNTLSTVSASGNNEPALRWLREALSSAFEAVPLSLLLRRRAQGFVGHIPSPLLARWAKVCRVDYESLSKSCPELADRLRTQAGREIICQHFNSLRIPSTVKRLDWVVTIVLRLLKGGKLPAEAEVINESVVALGTARCTPLGGEFLHRVAAVLRTQPEPDQLLERYASALEESDRQKLVEANRALNGTGFRRWVSDRLMELNTWLRDRMGPSIRWEIDTLPNNGGIYQFLLKGGKKHES